MDERFNNVKDLLISYGSPEIREFEIKLDGLQKDPQKFFALKKGECIYDFCKKFIQTMITANNIEAAYAGFYFISIHSRRAQQFHKYEEFDLEFGATFRTQSTYNHITNVYYLATAIPEAKYHDILQKSWVDYQKFDNHSGIVHCFADIVATIYEDAILMQKNDYITLIRNSYLVDALKAVEKAMSLSAENNRNYAKFYSTKGRLVAIEGDYVTGKKLIKQAISYEDNNGKIQAYENQLNRLELLKIHSGLLNKYELTEQHLQNMEKHVKSINSDLKDSVTSFERDINDKLSNNMIKNIEILTFFTSLIGFLVSSITIAVSTQSLRDAYDIIILIFAAFLVVFSTMDLILKVKYEQEVQVKPNYIAISIGVILILVMYFV